MRALVEPGIHGAFHRGPAGDASDRRNVDHRVRAVRAGHAKSAHRQIALGHGIDLSIGTQQRHHDQRSAAQGLGLADGRDGHVKALAGLGHRRQLGRDHDRGGVAGGRVDARRQRQAEAIGHAAHGQRGILQVVVAGSGQAHHDAIAGQLVGAQALERSQILDALGLDRLRCGTDCQQQCGKHAEGGGKRHVNGPSERADDFEEALQPALLAGASDLAGAAIDDLRIGDA